MNIEASVLSVSYMDTLSRQKSFIHNLDPRIKIVVTCLYCGSVLSLGQYNVSALIPFFLYPVFVLSTGRVPLFYIVKKVLVVSPFALMVALANPFIDMRPVVHIGSITISGGWLSFCSIMLKFILTVSGTLLLVATTGFDTICFALARLRFPGVIITQLLLLYRYLFVLSNEAARLLRAKTMRSFSKKNRNIFKTYGALLGSLLIRSINRAQRVHRAMLSRGFSGNIQLVKELHISGSDLLYILLWTGFLVSARLFNIARLSGVIIKDILQ